MYIINLIKLIERRPEQCAERALLVWSPAPISNSKRKYILHYYLYIFLKNIRNVKVCLLLYLHYYLFK